MFISLGRGLEELLGAMLQKDAVVNEDLKL